MEDIMKKVFAFLLITLLIFSLTSCGGSKNNNQSLDPNRTHEPCNLYGTTRVFGYEHQQMYDCIRDGDGWYQPGFGHHHHK